MSPIQKTGWGLVIAVIGVTLGWWAMEFAHRLESRPERAALVRAESSTREAQILAWIIELNPGASVKDFVVSEFPKALLQESKAAGIDYRLVMAVIAQESEFKPGAVGHAMEIGLMQIMPATAALVAKGSSRFADYKPPVKGAKPGTYASLGSLGDPVYNMRLGLVHLKAQVDKYGSWPTALRAYNRGEMHAKAFRPGDKYAEKIGLSMITIVQRFPE